MLMVAISKPVALKVCFIADMLCYRIWDSSSERIVDVSIEPSMMFLPTIIQK